MNNLGTKTLQTERLRLRKFRMDDVDGLFKWASDPRVTTFMSWDAYKDIEEARNAVEKWILQYEKNSYHWCVEEKNTHEIIGRINVVVHGNNNYCEVGFCYGAEYWNQGFATEALKAVIHYLLNEDGFHIVEAKCAGKNVASEKVLIKAGMKKEAVLVDRVYNKRTEKYDNLICYYI